MAARKLFERNDLTWEQVVEMEPRLAEMLKAAQQVDGSAKHFCANKAWYWDYKPTLCDLVGWGRKRGPYALTTSGAYDVAYETIYAALPGCRDCWCL